MIEILLATFNGAKYLPEQLDSLFNQTNQDWTLIVHDDGSTDETVDIIKSYQNRYPNRIKLVEDGIKTGGAKNNFAHLMQFANAEYIMFCDQDDVWLPEKIELTLFRMIEIESSFPEKPVLVHTDLVVVDERLNTIADSMFRYERLKNSPTLEDLFVRNNVTGCSLMINRVALIISRPVPGEALMHDWWLALKVKSSAGIIAFIDCSTIKYRQHLNNTVGVQQKKLKNIFKKNLKLKEVFDGVLKVYNQSKKISNVSYLQIFILKIKEHLRF